jgi:hypothetical protein
MQTRFPLPAPGYSPETKEIDHHNQVIHRAHEFTYSGDFMENYREAGIIETLEVIHLLNDRPQYNR